MSDLAGNSVAHHRSPNGLTHGDPETGWIVSTVEGAVQTTVGVTDRWQT